MTDEDLIAEAYRRMYRAMVDKDMAALDEVLDDSMVLVHMTGREQDKKSYMESIADGTLNYFSEEAEDVEIQVDGERAFMVGRSRVEAAVYGGGRGWWNLQLAMRLVKKDGVWGFTEGRASTY